MKRGSARRPAHSFEPCRRRGCIGVWQGAVSSCGRAGWSLYDCPMRSVFALVLFVLTAAPTAVAQPRSEQVDPSALAAAAARLGRVIWAPMATLDRIGVDPFVLRPPVAADCPDRTVYCPPVYRSDFVLGGVAGADVWMNLSERLLVQSRGRAVVDWYREFSDVSSVAPDVSQAVRYVGPRVHLDFGWRHVQSRRGMLAELAQRIRRTAFDQRLTAAVRVGRFALEAELGGQRVRHDDPPVAHRLFRYDWFDADITRTRALLRPAVAGPSRWSFTVERLEHQSFSRPVRERRLDATTVMLETELLTGLRLEGRVGVGWTRQRRPDYHEQLGAASSSLSAPLWRIDLSLPSEAGDLAFDLSRRFTQSVLPGPPALDELRVAVRGGRYLTRRLRADALVQSARILYLDRIDSSTSERARIDVGRVAFGLSFLVTARWTVAAIYHRNYWRDPFFARGLPDLRGSTFGMTVGYAQQGMAPSLPFVETW